MDQAVRAAFQLGPDIEWRWPKPGEKIFHRPEDGFVPVWLEHLWSGWHPRNHLFFKHLFKYVYKISPMQITPNGLKLMTWFLACCNKSKLQPTFKLFHQLFNLVKSSFKPLYELRFRFAECGFGPGHTKPIMQQSSLKHQNREIILLKGLDLFYMPYIVTDGVVTEFKPPVLEGKALKQVFDFCTCLGSQWTRDTFMDHKKMYRTGCKQFFLFLVRIGSLCIAYFCFSELLLIWILILFRFSLFQSRTRTHNVQECICRFAEEFGRSFLDEESGFSRGVQVSCPT